LEYFIQVVIAINRTWKTEENVKDLNVLIKLNIYTAPFKTLAQRRFALGFQEYEL